MILSLFLLFITGTARAQDSGLVCPLTSPGVQLSACKINEKASQCDVLKQSVLAQDASSANIFAACPDDADAQLGEMLRAAANCGSFTMSVGIAALRIYTPSILSRLPWALVKIGGRFVRGLNWLTAPVTAYTIGEIFYESIKADKACFENIEYKRSQLQFSKRTSDYLVQRYQKFGKDSTILKHLSFPPEYLDENFVKNLSCEHLAEILAIQNKKQTKVLGPLVASGKFKEDPRKSLPLSDSDTDLVTSLSQALPCLTVVKQAEAVCAIGNLVVSGAAINSSLQRLAKTGAFKKFNVAAQTSLHQPEISAEPAGVVQKQVSAVASPPPAAGLESALAGNDLQKISSAVSKENLTRRQLRAMEEVLTLSENKPYYASLSEEEKSQVDKLTKMPNARYLIDHRKDLEKEIIRRPLANRIFTTEMDATRAIARQIDREYLPNEITDNLLQELGFRDRNMRAKLLQCLKSAACLGKSQPNLSFEQSTGSESHPSQIEQQEKDRMARQTALEKKKRQGQRMIEQKAEQERLRKEAKKQAAIDRRMAEQLKKQVVEKPQPEELEKPADAVANAPDEGIASPIPDRPILHFKPDLFYVNKHVQPEKFARLLNDLTSGDPERVQLASKMAGAALENLKKYPGLSYNELPPEARAQVDRDLWEHLRQRATKFAGLTSYFQTEEELKSVKQAAIQAWRSGSPEIKIATETDASGVSSYYFSRNGTRYAFHICTQISDSCAQIGEVKTFYSVCGPGDRVFNLKIFEAGYEQIRESIRKYGIMKSLGTEYQPSIEFHPRDLGITSRKCN